MTAPAITDAITAVVSRVEAITPTIEPAARFRRVSETVPSTTRTRRGFDVEFQGHPRDLSNEGQGTQTQGLADRIARIDLVVEYPIARSEAALETTLAVDSELLLRALGRSAVWTSTPVRRCQVRTTVDRTAIEESGVLLLVVSVDVQYRDQG